MRIKHAEAPDCYRVRPNGLNDGVIIVLKIDVYKMDGTPDIHVPKHTVCNSFYVILNKNNSYLSGNASIFHCKLNFSISTGIIANDCISKQNVSFLYTCLGISFTSSSSQWSFSRFLSSVTLYFKNIVFKTYFPLKIF